MSQLRLERYKLERYKENNRIEAKQALGGFPRSIWETYSAFANTNGGVILLGVEETEDKTLRALDLPDPQRLVAQFWDQIQDKKIVNCNILQKNNVQIERIDGKEIVVIRVPKATRKQRPVYIGGNPFTGAYYRDGERDFRLPEEEVRKMLEKRGT